MLKRPSGKGRKRQKKGEKGRFRPISRTGGQTPLKPPFVTLPFAALQDPARLGLKFSIENENFEPRMKSSSENDFFVRGQNQYFSYIFPISGRRPENPVLAGGQGRNYKLIF